MELLTELLSSIVITFIGTELPKTTEWLNSGNRKRNLRYIALFLSTVSVIGIKMANEEDIMPDVSTAVFAVVEIGIVFVSAHVTHKISKNARGE